MTHGGVHVYCTYFDSGYLSRGLAMIESLRTVGEPGPVIVLALDDTAARGVAAAGLEHVHVVGLADVEAAFPELVPVKAERSRMEYLFTLTPWLVRFSMDRIAEAEWVTYLDADLYFFTGVEPVYRELAAGSVGIVPHRFAPQQSWREKYGHYNVGWVSFRPDTDGRACLRWWGDRCLEWCFDRPEEGRFADQGYLDRFEQVVSSVVVIHHPGVDTAPWNLSSHDIAVGSDGTPLVDGRPLVCFHFHGLTRDGKRYRFKHLTYRVRTTEAIRSAIYRPYVARLARLDATTSASAGARQRHSANALGRLRVTTLAWIGDRRGDFIDV